MHFSHTIQAKKPPLLENITRLFMPVAKVCEHIVNNLFAFLCIALYSAVPTVQELFTQCHGMTYHQGRIQGGQGGWCPPFKFFLYKLFLPCTT